MVVDDVARRLEAPAWRVKDSARQAHLAKHNLVLAEPLSYMNDSGYPVRKIASWWKVPLPQILVVSDDLDLPLGKLRMRASGGSGGHNGLKSIIEEIGGEDFPRLRVGIGRGGDDAIDHVLTTFGKSDLALVEKVIEIAVAGVIQWLDLGTVAATQFVNSWRPE